MSTARLRGATVADRPPGRATTAWSPGTSLPVGVVTLAERFGGRNVTPEDFEAMVSIRRQCWSRSKTAHGFRDRLAGRPVHLLGTSGTVTTVAGIQLGLTRYDRNRVDGCWLNVPRSATRVTSDLLARSYEERIAEPCIGRDRADLVLAGCAILEAMLRTVAVRAAARRRPRVCAKAS